MRTKLYILLCAALALLSSCAKPLGFEGDGNFTLELSCANATKATVPGVDALNENLISSVKYYLYPTGGTAQSAVCSGTVTVGRNSSASVQFSLSSRYLEELFPNDATSCEVFVIANYSGADPANTSVSSLQNLVLNTDFASATNGVQPSFVMSGRSTVTLNRNNPISGTTSIALKRVAAKLSLELSVADPITVAGAQWSPQLETISCTMRRLNRSTTLSGSTVDPVLFDYQPVVASRGTDDNGNPIAVFPAVYTYPYAWTPGTLNGTTWTENANAPTAFLSIRFQNSATGELKFFYYRVKLAGTSFASNNWYGERLNIAILGSEYSEEPVEVVVEDSNIHIDDWENAPVRNVEINEARYLTLLDNNIVLNNVNSADVSFISTHPIEVASVNVSKIDFSSESPTTVHPSFDGSISITDSKTLHFNRTLNNNQSTSNYDIGEYTYNILLRQIDKPSVSATLTIRQRPAVYITNERNSDTDNMHKGYVRVNAADTADAYSVYLTPTGEARANMGSNGAKFTSSSNNKNPNRYVIRTTVLPEGSSNVLGDPRLLTIDNLPCENGENWSKSATALYGSSPRKLTYYYPTSQSNEYDNIIAPAFMIADSHAATIHTSYRDAMKRCASIQIDGYPAGRWRVPTVAEIEYITKLSADGKIPILFTKGGNYWCNSGYVTVPRNVGEKIKYNRYYDLSFTTMVRCIYDTWYWGESKAVNVNTFTWGDRPR